MWLNIPHLILKSQNNNCFFFYSTTVKHLKFDDTFDSTHPPHKAEKMPYMHRPKPRFVTPIFYRQIQLIRPWTFFNSIFNEFCAQEGNFKFPEFWAILGQIALFSKSLVNPYCFWNRWFCKILPYFCFMCKIKNSVPPVRGC